MYGVLVEGSGRIYLQGLHVYMISFILLSALRQVHGPFQSEFSTECDLVLPLSTCSILSFHLGHPVAAYVFFLVLPSLLSLHLSFIQ